MRVAPKAARLGQAAARAGGLAAPARGNRTGWRSWPPGAEERAGERRSGAGPSGRAGGQDGLSPVG